jgi:hypothetical protein
MSDTNVRVVVDVVSVMATYVILAKHWIWLSDDGFM